tara:strand:+ start:588 stop:725 length:138 start_codon:yes stop_codon:yes gene_type:complete
VSVLSEYEINTLCEENVDDEMEEKLAIINLMMENLRGEELQMMTD